MLFSRVALSMTGFPASSTGGYSATQVYHASFLIGCVSGWSLVAIFRNRCFNLEICLWTFIFGTIDGHCPQWNSCNRRFPTGQDCTLIVGRMLWVLFTKITPCCWVAAFVKRKAEHNRLFAGCSAIGCLDIVPFSHSPNVTCARVQCRALSRLYRAGIDVFYPELGARRKPPLLKVGLWT